MPTMPEILRRLGKEEPEGSVMARRNSAPGYRVDIRLVDAGGVLAPYSADRIDRDMADSLATHLKRNNSAGRIVEVPSEEVIETWEAK
jgi:hypothetical protein